MGSLPPPNDVSMRKTAFLLLTLLLLATGCTATLVPVDPAGAAFERLRNDEAALRGFMRAFPKGGDIHHHLVGAPTPEMFMLAGAEGGFCLDPASLGAVPGPCTGSTVAFADVMQDADLSERLADAWSMRQFGRGDDAAPAHFFGIFPQIWPVVDDRGFLLAQLKKQAAAENLLYLETQLQVPAATDALRAAAMALPPTDDVVALREALRADGILERHVTGGLATLQRYSDTSAFHLKCKSKAPDPGCAVEHRFQIYALRILPTPMVLADMILAFELAARAPAVVGVNVVGFEGDSNALANYDLHMRALGQLAVAYPDVRLALHAGEITAREADADALATHVPKALYTAAARRIGHGNAIATSAERATLLEDLAITKTAVEVSLTSNELLLGLVGADHHLKLVWDAGIPVTLNTDDAGIFATDLSREYLLAAQRYPWLTYEDFKTLSRQALEVSFLSGASWWRDGVTSQPVAVCAARSSTTCAQFLDSSDRARLQAQLEDRLADFEQRLLRGEL